MIYLLLNIYRFIDLYCNGIFGTVMIIILLLLFLLMVLFLNVFYLLLYYLCITFHRFNK